MVATKASLVFLCSTITFYFVDEPVSLRLLPSGDCRYCCPVVERRDITFLLTTANNTKRPDILVPGDTKLLEKSHFNKDLPTVIYLHGFTESAKGSSCRMMREAYVRRGGWNIVMVDWQGLSAVPYYVSAANNTKKVGAYLAKFILFLEENGVPVSSLHLVGFSLGAEAAGFAGQLLGGRLPRITGLDPAYPLFDVGGWDSYLSPNDAQFVDIIHSNGGLFGHPVPLGHVDFYPNSGRFNREQPGCKDFLLGRARRPYIQYVGCSHNRAWRFYVESVNNECGFPSSRCGTWRKFLSGGCRGRSLEDVNYMGIAAKPMKTRTRFYLRTHDYPPYGIKEAVCQPSGAAQDASSNAIRV